MNKIEVEIDKVFNNTYIAFQYFKDINIVNNIVSGTFNISFTEKSFNYVVKHFRDPKLLIKEYLKIEAGLSNYTKVINQKNENIKNTIRFIFLTAFKSYIDNEL